MARRFASPAEVLRVVRECVATGAWIIDAHCRGRMRERDVTLDDLTTALRRARRAVPYQGNAWNGGDEWRVFGPDAEGQRTLGVGIELVTQGGTTTIVMTVFEEKRR